MMLHVHAHTGTDDDNHIVLKPTDTFKGERFINACYIDVRVSSNSMIKATNLLDIVVTF